MSTYVTLQGWVTCPDLADFDKLKSELVADEFMDGEGFWECVDGAETPHARRDTLTFVLPFHLYRNLGRFNFFPRGIARGGRIVGTCTDGFFVGWISTPDGGAAERSLMSYAEGPRPDADNDLQAYCQWQNEAESNFHEKHA